MNNNGHDIGLPPISEGDQREARIIFERVVMLLNEMRKIYNPEMRLTFVARHPLIPELHTFLTDEDGRELDNLKAFVGNIIDARKVMMVVPQEKGGPDVVS